MKKLMFAMLLVTAMTLVGCQKEQNFMGTVVLAQKDVYGYQMMSSAQMLQMMPANQSRKLTAHEITDEQIEKVHQYMNMMEELINDNAGYSSVITESDKEGYTFLLTITSKDLAGEVTTYALYYNETIQQEADEDKDIDEVESTLEGIAIIDGVEYQVIGEKEREEDELETSFTMIIDEKNYVKVKQEIEQEEQEYVYQIVQDGKVVRRYSMELEQAADEVSLLLKDITKTDQTIYKFKMVGEADKKMILITIVENDVVQKMKVRMVLDSSTNEYVYEYQYKDNGGFVYKTRK